ncbi:hypothetical protein ACHAPO_008839 [Fusarium lateritium]
MADDTPQLFPRNVRMSTAEELHGKKHETAKHGLEERLQNIANQPSALPTREASFGANAPDVYNLPTSVTVHPINKPLRRVIYYEFGYPEPPKKAKMKERKRKRQPPKHPRLQPRLLPKLLPRLLPKLLPRPLPRPDNTDSVRKSKAPSASHLEACQNIVSEKAASDPA